MIMQGTITLTEQEVKEILALHIAEKFNVNVQAKDVAVGVHTSCVAGGAAFLDAVILLKGETL